MAYNILLFQDVSFTHFSETVQVNRYAQIGRVNRVRNLGESGH